mmetsp:Transcript_34536/g.111489  ORF Transcript_34536/g.111489 Transcript_34536/m.111489 type:complete len:268 (+) Transcript_34536:476-1279(+)|eukprot:scaffold30733_cov129-Isochrysis_galbana.AAC.8
MGSVGGSLPHWGLSSVTVLAKLFAAAARTASWSHTGSPRSRTHMRSPTQTGALPGCPRSQRRARSSTGGGHSCTRLAAKYTSGPTARNRPRVASGSAVCPSAPSRVPCSAVAWSVVVTLHREQPLTTRKVLSPIRMRRQVSSSNASQPLTTIFGRKRFMGSGAPGANRRLSSSRELELARRTGKPSAKPTCGPPHAQRRPHGRYLASSSRFHAGCEALTSRTDVSRKALSHAAAPSPRSSAVRPPSDHTRTLRIRLGAGGLSGTVRG